MPSIEERVQRLEDESEIKRLKAKYCEFCDNSYDADEIASLFIQDGVWDGGFYDAPFDQAVPAEASAGSLILWDGRTWHATGENSTTAKPA